MPQKRYPAKILLFGEYATLLNGRALAIPFPQKSGGFSFARPNTRPLTPIANSIKNLQLLLEQLLEKGTEELAFDISAFAGDLGKGLWFDSDIPQGYGLGSSGALVAALYDRYVPIDSQASNAAQLKKDLALLESFFHGQSSGNDPLVSKLGKPIALASKTEFSFIEQLRNPQSFQFFLLDTGSARQTAPLVKLFYEKLENGIFANPRRQAVLLERHKQLIEAIQDLSSPTKEQVFEEAWRQLSMLQYRYFEEMIPDDLHQIWLEDFDRLNDYRFLLKICGAGGGGYMLGISKDITAAKAYFGEEQVIPFQLNE